MNRNVKGFRLNKNGKPIMIEVGEVRFKIYQGASYKSDGVYYFFKRNSNGKFVYST